MRGKNLRRDLLILLKIRRRGMNIMRNQKRELIKDLIHKFPLRFWIPVQMCSKSWKMSIRILKAKLTKKSIKLELTGKSESLESHLKISLAY